MNPALKKASRLPVGSPERRKLLLQIKRASSITPQEVAKWRQFTARGMHTEAAILLAQMLGRMKEAKILDALLQIQEMEGGAPKELVAYRRRYTDVYDDIARDIPWGTGTLYEALYG